MHPSRAVGRTSTKNPLHSLEGSGTDTASAPTPAPLRCCAAERCGAQGNRVKNEGNFPDGFTLHLELGNVETCDQALLPFCELFKKGVASDQPAMSFKKQVKRLLLAMSNGSGVGNWLQNAGIHVSSEGLKDFENSQLLRTWKAETRKYHAVVSNRHPDLLHCCKSQNKWYPECSVTNALDERDERLGVDSLMQLAERVHDIPIASVEHDGVVFWSYNEANLMAQVRRVSQGLAFAVKALRNAGQRALPNSRLQAGVWP